VREAELIPVPTKRVETIQRTATMPKSHHVAFSSTSVVLRTPIILLVEAKGEARPPPLDFCTITSKTSPREASRMSTERK